MSRPRIRSIKPEAQQDERVGDLSRDARCLFFLGLLTLADDEGRLRAMPAAIIGHTFPYDSDVTPSKLRRWLDEIERAGLILRYELDGRAYIAIRHFKRHQRIDKPTASTLPPPPDPGVINENSAGNAGSFQDRSANVPGSFADRSCSSRVRVGSDRIGSEFPLDPPPAGERKRDRVLWERTAVAWARAVGVDGPEGTVLRAVRQAQPWALNGDGPERFRVFAREQFARSLSVTTVEEQR